MKKVIFICLLSFSICMSRPDGVPGSAPQAAATKQPPPQNLPSQPTEHNDTATVPPAPKTMTTSVVTEVSLPPTPVVTAANDTKTINDTNRTTDKNETAKPIDATPVTEKPTPTPSPAPEIKGNATADQPLKNVTTTVKPTTAETPKATDIPPVQARGFDGPSFIGGIILTLGLLAIGFMGFKYYKNHTEGIYNPLS